MIYTYQSLWDKILFRTIFKPYFENHLKSLCTSLVLQTGKSLAAMQETWVWSLSWEDPLEKSMATHSSMVAWIIPWTEEPGRLLSMESHRSERLTYSFFFLSLRTTETWLQEKKRLWVRKHKKGYVGIEHLHCSKHFTRSESESRSAVFRRSDSLRPHGLSMDFSRPEYWSG